MLHYVSCRVKTRPLVKFVVVARAYRGTHRAVLDIVVAL